ncbi:hypothetical protein [Lentzea kentuckyensis]|uniref:hypothetical protein n=1 Tax=Lentzea kentuckyensis TaxID=360086 RepID=UPI000A3B24E7|nr:hypothetical protein [Lentzea kentuckyensis]
MDPGVPDVAFDRWWHAMRDVAATRATSLAWRQHRYKFAHRLGRALTADPPLTGPAVYGVWLQWGLLYVGQTLEAERRLRDLAIGESHHLANTYPPEIWHHVVVVSWPQLPEAARVLDALSPKAIGEGLEHRLQEALEPLANASRRTSDGQWRDVDWKTSRSLGARTGKQLDDLFAAVLDVWNTAASSTNGENVPSSSRIVFPSQLLSDV